MLKLLSILTILLSSSLFSGTIKIAVAANVSYAIDDLKKEFHKLYPNTKVLVILGSSGKLTAQIKHGAPYQLFMSANMNFPNSLYKEKVAITKPLIYAQGTLAMFSTKKQNFLEGLKLLKEREISKIAIGNPKTAPYGKAALQALKSSGVYDDILKKLVYAESISQTLSYTIVATDIGIVASSSLYSSKMKHFKKDQNWVEINPSLYSPIDQGIVILKDGQNSSEVEAFYNFILSEQAKNIFKKFGYIVP
ncbi:MAG: molybdate ABC transporter substrate-binding protein [Helicobacteraceae bacterium]|nr:molybdate ABC transporter substrate-binding protein [Helicobacteraceae bacterium]